jgi:hypothetical protein
LSKAREKTAGYSAKKGQAAGEVLTNVTLYQLRWKTASPKEQARSIAQILPK